MERCERKAEVQELNLDHCYNISPDDVERLKKIVVDVIWNGVERVQGWDDDSDDSPVCFGVPGPWISI